MAIKAGKDFSLGSVEKALYSSQLSVLHSSFKNSLPHAPQILAGIPTNCT